MNGSFGSSGASEWDRFRVDMNKSIGNSYFDYKQAPSPSQPDDDGLYRSKKSSDVIVRRDEIEKNRQKRNDAMWNDILTKRSNKELVSLDEDQLAEVSLIKNKWKMGLNLSPKEMAILDSFAKDENINHTYVI